jgi:hypothetical protein
MLLELENPSLVQPQSFPDRIAALDSRIERADSGFVAMDQLPVDVDDQVAVFRVKLLKHEKKEGLIRKTGKQEKNKK